MYRFLTLALILTGCGTEHDSANNNMSSSDVKPASPVAELDGTQGPKGDAGKDGAAGKDGKDGDDGEQGDAGKDGADGKDAEIQSATMWYDPIEERYWNIGPYQPFTDTACKNDFVAPMLADIEAARPHGLFLETAAIGGYHNIWLPKAADGTKSYIADNGVITASPSSPSAGIVCIKKIDASN